MESDIQVQVIPVEEDAFREEMSIVTAPHPGLAEGMKVVENGAGR